jgi:hypothetical protein
MFFGAVVGAIPLAVVLPIAILFLSMLKILSNKLKGNGMKANVNGTTSKTTKTKTMTTKCLSYILKLAGNIPAVVMVIGSDMTAEVAGHQL